MENILKDISFASDLLSGSVPPTMTKQAEQFWQMLSELAEKDPEAYKAQVQKVLSDYKAEEVNNPKAVPSPGLSIQCTVKSVVAFLEAMRPKKFAYLDEIGASDAVYMNICSMPNVRAPLDVDGQDVVELERKGVALGVADLLNLEIPMAVGPLRKVSDGPKGWAVDIVCHGWVVNNLLSNNVFLTEFGKFLMEVVSSELRLKFETFWKRHEESYVGKVENSPVPFFPFHELDRQAGETTMEEMLEKVNKMKGKGEKMDVVLPGVTRDVPKSVQSTFLDVPDINANPPKEDHSISTFASVLASALPTSSTVWKPATKDYSTKIVSKHSEYEFLIRVHFDLSRVNMKLADANLDFSVSEKSKKVSLLLDLPRSCLIGYDGLALDRIPLLVLDPIELPDGFLVSEDTDPKAKYSSKTGILTIRIPVMKNSAV